MRRIENSPALTGGALVVEIHRQARAFAERGLAAAVADDIAQDITLDCLVKIRAGQWTPPAADLSKVLREIVRRRAADWVRRRQHGAQRNAEHGRELKERVRAWMSPELDFEERELVGGARTNVARPAGAASAGVPAGVPGRREL